MKKENLAIISNEKTQNINNNFFCDNIDLKSIPEGLNENFNLELFLRNSKIERSSHKINLKKIFISGDILSFLYKILRRSKVFKKYLIISLSPYTFFSCLILYLLGKKVYLYLRSDGYEEYRCYSRFFGPLIYHIMFNIASWTTKIIVCRSHLLRGKRGVKVSPSQLSTKWFVNRKSIDHENIKMLYVGRIKIEKGVSSLLNILSKIKLNYKLQIINSEKNYDKPINNKNIQIIHFKNKDDSIIHIYDDNNIFILPSFTEAHPQVLDESLARLRPVIIFPEISHVTRNREGVFVANRDPESLSNVIKFILKNYSSIQSKMVKNNLPTKKKFLAEISKIIKNE